MQLIELTNKILALNFELSLLSKKYFPDLIRDAVLPALESENPSVCKFKVGIYDGFKTHTISLKFKKIRPPESQLKMRRMKQLVPSCTTSQK